MIVFTVTFTLFLIEALLHYNYGKDDYSQFHLPTTKEFLQIGVTVFIFSFLNSFILRQLAKRFHLH
jgi:hypothetical protein